MRLTLMMNLEEVLTIIGAMLLMTRSMTMMSQTGLAVMRYRIIDFNLTAAGLGIEGSIGKGMS